MKQDDMNRLKGDERGPTVRQIAEIICPGYAHNLRGLMTDDERDTGKACARCHVWAIGIRDVLNRLKVEDTPGRPWEAMAQELYRGHFITYRACYFCGRSVGHADDCQWN